jgi:hypothetical protein
MFPDKLECYCHFLAPSTNCMTHHHELQDITNQSQVSLHKNNKINLPTGGAKTDVPFTVVCQIISESNVKFFTVLQAALYPKLSYSWTKFHTL